MLKNDKEALKLMALKIQNQQPKQAELIEAKKRRKEKITGKLIKINDMINIYDAIQWVDSATDPPPRVKSPVAKRKTKINRNNGFELDSRDFCKKTRESKPFIQRLAQLPEETA